MNIKQEQVKDNIRLELISLANCSILRDSPAGGIVSNIKDMAKFASFAVTQMGETPKEKWVLSGNSMKEMIKKQVQLHIHGY